MKISKSMLIDLIEAVRDYNYWGYSSERNERRKTMQEAINKKYKLATLGNAVTDIVTAVVGSTGIKPLADNDELLLIFKALGIEVVDE